VKKLFAVLLILALLLPVGMPVHAEEIEKKPFYLSNWSNFRGEYTNVFFMPSIPSGTNSAQKLKEIFDTYPDGARFVNFGRGSWMLSGNVEAPCFFGKGVTALKAWLETYLAEYSSLGGKLDGLSFDIEYLNIYAHYIHDNYFKKDPTIYSKMEQNQEYQTKIRPRLVERGFKFYENITPNTPELYCLNPNSGSQYEISRSIWDTVMRSYLGECIREACEPLWKYYPDAEVNDYQSKNVKPWLKELSDNGGVLGGGGIQTTAGDSCNENFYFIRPTSLFYTNSSTRGPQYMTIPAYTDAIYEQTPFHNFMYDTVLAKDTYLASDDGNVSWWIAHFLYTKSATSPYYAETLYHLGLLNPSIFLGYIYANEFAWDGDYETSLEVVDACLQELTRVAGFADRKTIYATPNWNHHFVLTGMYAGGRNIWRLTPDTSMVSVADFKTEGTELTFSVGGETITFPQGKIITDKKVLEIGTCGYWIGTPENVTPIITRTADYHKNYPAFAETYENYAPGTEYNYNNALPEACWEMKKQGGGTGTVVADGNGQSLAIKGTFTAKNVYMPENITSGDTYAKHQAWEVSFTLPADFAADAELILLDSAGKKNTKDGGFKIAGGKVYYSQGENYVELPGVTLTAGTKYRVVRDMDFTNADAITCDYYIYSGATLLGSVMDIAVAPIDLPATSISIGCKKVAGEPVLLDDYKLYPTGVQADLTLYDAKTGMKVTEPEQARQGSTAYRVAWVNATNDEQSYSLIAQYYNGESLVEEKIAQDLKMAPNADGLLTGIVENKSEGQLVQVYLKDNNATEPEPTPEEVLPPAAEPAPKGISWILIAAIGATVAVVAASVIVIVVSKKKKSTEE